MATSTLSAGTLTVAGSIRNLSSGSVISLGAATQTNAGTLTSSNAFSGSLLLTTGVQLVAGPLAVVSTVDAVGTIKQTLNYTVTRMILDAARHRIYATDNANNRVLVFDTTSMSLLTTILVGSAPYGLDMSPDGTTLYVANSGSTTKAFSVIDLETLTVTGTIGAPVRPYYVVVGLENRLYASTNPANNNNSTTQIMQIDLVNAANNVTFGSYNYGSLAISPDRKTLFAGNRSDYYSSGLLGKYDVATASAALLQTSSSNSSPLDLILSHDGKTLSYFRDNIGNALVTPTSDLTGIDGTLLGTSSPYFSANSPDDTVTYITNRNYYGGIDIFDSLHFFKNAHVTLPDGPDYYSSVTALLADETNTALYMATSTKLFVLATGRTTPTITSSLTASAGKNVNFFYQIGANQSPTSYLAAGLPAGLTVNATSGVISGKATSYGIYTVNLTASNSVGSGTAVLTLTIGVPLNVSVAGQGTVTPSYSGTTYAVSGSSVTIAATPQSSDYQFIGWTGDIPSTANPLTFTVQAGTTLKANFAPIAPTIISNSDLYASPYNNVYSAVTTDHPATSLTIADLPAGFTFDYNYPYAANTKYLTGTIAPGVYELTATATNDGGTTSKVLTLHVAAYLSYEEAGPGTASPDNYDDYFYPGLTYSFTAVPNAGAVFTGWTGTSSNLTPNYSFVMEPDFDLQANFRYFGTLKGKYIGLLEDQDVLFGPKGSLSLQIQGHGAFTGVVTLDGHARPFAGRFAQDGTSTVTFPNGHHLDLRITEINNSGLQGLFQVVGSYTVGDEVIPVQATISIFAQGGFWGSLSLQLPAADPEDVSLPPSASLKVKISPTGLVQVTGKLSDGTKIAVTTRLRGDLSFVIYTPLYGNHGSLSGLMTLDNETGIFNGQLSWVKAKDAPARFQTNYPDGFAIQINATTDGAPATSLGSGPTTPILVGGGVSGSSSGAISTLVPAPIWH